MEFNELVNRISKLKDHALATGDESMDNNKENVKKKIYFLGKTKEIAEIEMHKTVSTLVPFEEISFKNKNQIKLKNGTVYIAIFGGESAKGIYCDEAYVDRNIDLMTFQNVIYPRVKGRTYIF